MNEKQREQNDTSNGQKGRALDPRNLHQQEGNRLGWFQVGASILDAAARLLDIALRGIR